ncbi:hypothetical protein SRB5_60820 [Streptomyces sp. RB5]|uniref:Secreted protein n=1 Tax=Streptomyces smaragdinus TaxID=2585196 RepID=A0A7K0CQY7_9ACTN|nr:ATP-binding protein [Streptomyces smaragdinus]MQY15890.1 hypothetical protein [Streptomyces smaragdinus]
MNPRKILGATLLGAAFAAASAGAACAADGVPGNLPGLSGLAGLGSGGVTAPDQTPVDSFTAVGQQTGPKIGSVGKPKLAVAGITDNLPGGGVGGLQKTLGGLPVVGGLGG